ncbi:glycoside hydrolase family 15 protein [Rahnella victoriana]|uniref:glycoside hydrolase family 15 protein n=1 Tax=Rahnella victoriana TaxID=1510570 RepID=UPI001E3A194D|nr:glycoside hydrolase family 15 protein [Rahnella victoriana]UHM93202.1 glycoside hydrolase family 15 protein [Rahnella victoriana]
MAQQFPGEFRDEDGFCDLGDYAAVGEGRTVTLLSPDGSADWWCVPSLDSPPLFDRLLDAKNGGYFQLVPRHPYRMTRQYRENSNVLESVYETETGKVKVTESINSTLAGRLPWNEFARRIEGLSGSVLMTLRMKIGTAAASRSPWRDESSHGTVWHVGSLQLMLRLSEAIRPGECHDAGAESHFTVHRDERLLAAVLVTENAPLAVPGLARIDKRIDMSDTAWRSWADNLEYDGKFQPYVLRSALALKFLWYAPTGALAAAATTSLPEGAGSGKNYDYRYAWVRDACMIIKSFIYTGALEDCQAAFSWLAGILRENGCEMHTCFQLNGQPVPEERYIEVEGYRAEQPVRVGNNAARQLQLSNYGDILDTAVLFTDAGHVLDLDTSRLLGQLANHCADTWRQKDSGIWELPEPQHYTQSKMACWVALNQAVHLAKGKYIEPTWEGRWQRERDRIRDWIETRCWSEERQSYTFWPGSQSLDASVALMHQYGQQVSPKRMLSTLQQIEQELGTKDKMLYRYSGVDKEENTFVACAFWMVAALAVFGETEEAEKRMNALLKTHQGDKSAGIMSEMYDVDQKKCCGNMPQGLSHLSVICAAHIITQVTQGK